MEAGSCSSPHEHMTDMSSIAAIGKRTCCSSIRRGYMYMWDSFQLMTLQVHLANTGGACAQCDFKITQFMLHSNSTATAALYISFQIQGESCFVLCSGHTRAAMDDLLALEGLTTTAGHSLAVLKRLRFSSLLHWCAILCCMCMGKQCMRGA